MEIKNDFLKDNFSIIFNRKLIFGIGKIKTLNPLIKEYSYPVLFILSRSFQKSERWIRIKENLEKDKIKFYEEGVSGEPNIETIDRLSQTYREMEVKLIVSIGGGSAIDTGKALSSMLLEEGRIADYLEVVGTKKPTGSKKPFISVPTTAGTGSEATKNAVISKVGENGFKKSIRHDNLVPDSVILDPELLKDLPIPSRIPSALDALSQLIESYTSLKSNLLTDTLCEKAFYLLGKSIKNYLSGETEIEYLSNMLISSYISGFSLANAGLGVIHGFA
ncbi:MAG: iron-containing alcohol dehydrogenase, partial [Brevinematia bacterium]